MLSQEENELLTRVGPGTPMGGLFRRYWVPALLSSEVPEPDCPPVRVRLLGEALVAFRDTDGRIGLLEERCSHRRASLFYGRNEECGLRCIYHGWKYDVDGNILDTPAEPRESMLRYHVKHQAYPCREANGLIYAYLGPRDRMPLLPDLPWITLPADHVRVGRKVFNDCSWLQTQEGNLDSVHSPFLHGRGGGDAARRWRNQNNPPTFDIDRTSWGVRAIVRYPAEDGGHFIRTNTFVMPYYAALPNADYVDGRLDGFQVNIEVPVDDETTMRFSVHVQRTVPITRRVRDFPLSEVGADSRKVMNRANDYGLDREKQRAGVVFSGIDSSNAIQDGCVVESMGAISDRTREHLGVTDTQVVAVRQFVLDAVRGFQRGEDPPSLARSPGSNDFSDLYLVSATIPADRDWRSMVPEVTTHSLAGVT